MLPKAAKFLMVPGAALTLLIGAVAAAGAPAARAAPGNPSPWSQTDHNAAQSRANLAEQILTRATVAKVRYLRGEAATLVPPGLSCGFLPVVAPVLTGGRLYAMTGGWLSVYDAATGHLIWRRNPDPTFQLNYYGVAVAGGLVIVGGQDCSMSDPNGFILAFSAATGALVWKQGTEGGGLQHMVVSNGYVIAEGDSQGGGDRVTVLRLSTGAAAWQRLTNPCGYGSVLVVAQLVLSPRCPITPTGGTDYNLTANKLATGARVWNLPGTWQLQRGDTDAATGQHVYATNPGGTLVSLDPLTGTTQYSLAGASQVLAVDNLRAYALCGSLGVCGYNSASGGLAWHTPPNATPGLAAEAGGVLYLNSGPLLNTGNGQPIITLWDVGQASALAVGSGRVAVVTDLRIVDLYGLPGY